MQDVVIVDAARSAVGRKKGALGWVHPTDTLGPVMMKMLERNNVAPDAVDHASSFVINCARDRNLSRDPEAIVSM